MLTGPKPGAEAWHDLTADIFAIDPFANEVLGKGSVLYNEWPRCPGDTRRYLGTLIHAAALVSGQRSATAISNQQWGIKPHTQHGLGAWGQVIWFLSDNLGSAYCHQWGHVGDERYQEKFMKQEIGQVFYRGPRTALGVVLARSFKTASSSLGLRPFLALA